MLTFLINLDAAEERRRRMQPRLDAAGITAERVGIDLRGRAPAEIQGWFAQHFPAVELVSRDLCSAELGCWASHLVAWRRLAASRAECCTVLEDDVLLTSAFTATVAALHRLPLFDVVFLGTSSRNISTRRRTRIGSVWVHMPRGVIFNTWGYVITRAYVERVLAARPFAIAMPLDHFLGGRAKVLKPRIAVVRPAVLAEDGTAGLDSQIQPYATRMDRHPWWQAARRALLASRVSDLYYAIYRWL